MAERCPYCTWEEVPNQVPGSSVTAYRIVDFCTLHMQQQEDDAATEIVNAANDYRDELIATRARENAIDDLIADGILDSDGNVIESSS